jgi:agmatinase
MPDSRRRPVLIGLGYDASSSFLRGAALAPPIIREALRSPSANGWSESGIDLWADGVLGDEGDLALPASGEARGLIEGAIRDIVERGDRPLSLGGDHSITYSTVRGVASRESKLTVVQIDAHPDLYDEFEGDRYSHACQFARIREEGLAAHLIQAGIRTITAHQRDQAKRFGVDVIDMRRWTRGDRPRASGPVYLSIDLDGIDPAFAPGVSHPEPGGLTVREVLDVVRDLDGPIVGADIVELNPHRDVHGLTAVVAAKLVKEVAARMIETWSAVRIGGPS